MKQTARFRMKPHKFLNEKDLAASYQPRLAAHDLGKLNAILNAKSFQIEEEGMRIYYFVDKPNEK